MRLMVQTKHAQAAELIQEAAGNPAQCLPGRSVG